MRINIQTLFNVGAIAFLAGWASWRFADFPSGLIIQFVGLALMIPYWIQRSFRLFRIHQYPQEQKKNIVFTGILSVMILIFIILFIVVALINLYS
jgi:hypothetical protein